MNRSTAPQPPDPWEYLFSHMTATFIGPLPEWFEDL